MGRIYDSILELTGRTPLVELHRIEELEEARQESLENWNILIQEEV